MMNFTVEWDGKANENLWDLLDKTHNHSPPQSGSLNSHLITIRKSSSVSEVIALWMGYPGVPDLLKSNPIFIGVLSITTLALLSPRSLKIIPDSAGEILNIFQNKGFYRVISKSKLLEIIDDPLIVEQGIQFLINRKLVDTVDEDSYKLLEIPLTNLRIKFD